MNDENADSKKVMLSSLVLHRALALEEEETWLASQHNTFLADILYLAVLLEKFVLHERLAVFDEQGVDRDILHLTGVSRRDDEGSFRSRIAKSAFLNELLAANAIEFIEGDLEAKSDQIVDVMFELSPEFEEFDDDASAYGRNRGYVASSIVEIRSAFDLNYSFIPDQSADTRDALDYLNRQNNFNVSLLAQAYRRVSDDLRGDIMRLVNAGANKKVFLPPIPAIVLSRAAKPSDISRIAVELRHEFAETRNQFSEYERRICDDSLPIRESLDALNGLDSALVAITPRTATSLATSITEWRDLTDLSKVFDGLSTDEATSLIKMGLNMPMKLIAKKIKTRKVNYLSVMRKNFLNITGYGRLVERLFGRQISNGDFKVLREGGIGSGFTSYILK